MRAKRAIPLPWLATGLVLMMVYFALSQAKPASIVKVVPKPLQTVGGGLVCTPKVDFGQVTIGQTKTMSFNCTNTGSVPITITGVSTTWPFTVQPPPIPPNPPGSVTSIEARRHQ